MNETYLRRAIRLAVENVEQGRGGPFGALVVRDGEVLSEGANHVTTWNDPTAHAEVVAIREACRKLGAWNLRGAVIYASCEPCPMCLAAIYWARLDALFYSASRQEAAAAGFDDGLLYEQIPLADPERSLACRRLLALEGIAPFDAWRESPGRTAY
jgi:tRNA(Arg) A34 adenosine deaminase TadA